MENLKVGVSVNVSSMSLRELSKLMHDLSSLGIDAVELGVVEGIPFKRYETTLISRVASSLNLLLTVHAPYYINLLSQEEKKLRTSFRNILRASAFAEDVGAFSVVFHTGYYRGLTREQAIAIAERRFDQLLDLLRKYNISLLPRPETMGKVSQFGSLEELSYLYRKKQIIPCFDFAHIHARYGGILSTPEGVDDLFAKIDELYGKEIYRDMHIHLSGIEYGSKGEKRHLPLRLSDLAYEAIIDRLLSRRATGVIQIESPEPVEDALLVKDLIG